MVKNADTVQTFGRKKSAVAVAVVQNGTGMIRVNGTPLDFVNPPTLRIKCMEPILLLGKDCFSKIDMRIRVRGGGHTSQIYAIRQAIAKGVIVYYQKFVDEATKKEIKDILVKYDRNLVAVDPRQCEPKKFGGPGARARYQKSYR